MYLITKWFGTFICDKNGIKNQSIFPKNSEEIGKRLIKIYKNEILPEEKRLAKGLTLIVNEKRLQKIGDYTPSDSFFNKIEIQPGDFDFSQDIINKASIILAQKKVEEKLKAKDLQIIQMINTLDDFIQTSNLLHERLDSWSILPASKEKIQPLKNAFSTINKEMGRIEKQIGINMYKIAPNISNLIGPLIGARLMSHASGIERLATLPASTIQILGAEKALFRFKKEGGKPPKHGIIFQHPLINKASKEKRGKIARIIATKIAIAAKADVFTKIDISKDLKKDLEKRIKDIRNP
ncbi:MAG: hypothetical protein JSW62_05950 [Thermoplasmatales archaeon]|nr:MAG: hypothetical protein JSW62_05950 [Thermoplasmatales archaeon]